MKTRHFLSIIFLAAAFIVAPLLVNAQIGADNAPLFSRHNDEDRPKSIREGIEKIRIDKEKKDHDEMIARGDDAAKLASDLEASFTRSGKLTSDDISKAGKLEKLIKRIRDDLGGGDGDKDQNGDDPEVEETPVPNSLPEAIQAVRSKSDALNEQLKQTTRFTISADAIQTSNTLLKIIKVIRTRQ